jgi:4-amino-4-deoxy-L-arabinose transferase-like glycosyltransferase
VLAGLAFRALYLWELSTLPAWDHARGDEAYFLRTAAALSEGSFERPFHMSPLYTGFLALLQGIFGTSPLVWRSAQVLLGVTGCLLLAATARRLLGPWAGAWALGLSLFCAPLIFYESNLAVATLAGTLLISILYCALRWRDARASLDAPNATRGTGWWAAAAALTGLAITARPNAALLLAPLALFPWLQLPGAPARQKLLLCAMVPVVALAVTSPVTWHNLRADPDPIWITDTGGANFFIGNHRQSTGSFNPPPGLEAAADIETQEAAFRAVAVKELGGEPSRAQVSAYWTRRTLAEIAADPGRWLRLLGRKLLMVFNAEDIANNRSLSFRSELMLSLGPWLIQLGYLLPFALLGIGLWLTRPREFFLPLSFTLCYVVALMLIFVIGRYRQVLIPLFILAAVSGMHWIYVRSRSRDTRRLLVGLVFCGAMVVVCGLPLLEDPWAQHASRHAQALHVRGDLKQAEHWYLRTLDRNPKQPTATKSLALLYEQTARLDRAEVLWRQLLEDSRLRGDRAHEETARAALERLVQRRPR